MGEGLVEWRVLVSGVYRMRLLAGGKRVVGFRRREGVYIGGGFRGREEIRSDVGSSGGFGVEDRVAKIR